MDGGITELLIKQNIILILTPMHVASLQSWPWPCMQDFTNSKDDYTNYLVLNFHKTVSAKY